MNEQVAYALIDAELRRLQELSYADLSALIGKVETKELVGEDGKKYQLEIQAFWDSKKGADIRLIVAADDGGWEGVQATDGRLHHSPGWLAGVKVSCRPINERNGDITSSESRAFSLNVPLFDVSTFDGEDCARQ